jgi:hypothetical protein
MLVNPDNELRPGVKRIVIFGLMAVIVVISINMPGIRQVFTIVGSTSGNLISFILPAGIYLKLLKQRDENGLATTNDWFLKWIAMFSVVFGFFSMFICLTASIVYLLK